MNVPVSSVQRDSGYDSTGEHHEAAAGGTGSFAAELTRRFILFQYEDAKPERFTSFITSQPAGPQRLVEWRRSDEGNQILTLPHSVQTSPATLTTPSTSLWRIAWIKSGPISFSAIPTYRKVPLVPMPIFPSADDLKDFPMDRKPQNTTCKHQQLDESPLH